MTMTVKVIVPMVNHVWTVIDFNFVAHVYAAGRNFYQPAEIVVFATLNQQHQLMFITLLC
jgi:hypothetical protein